MTPNPLLEAALGYLRLGYRIVPNLPGQKRPRYKAWPSKAFTTEEEIQNHWGVFPADNVGILTVGLQVIDIDAGEKPHPWQTDPKIWEDLSGAPLAVTPRGGWHAFFREPEGKTFSSTVNTLSQGVDTRARGGQIVVAPSQVDGRSYNWHVPLVAWDQLPNCPECFYTNNSTKETIKPPDKIEQLKKGLNIAQVFENVEKQVPSSNGQVSGLCPFHKDQNNSFSYCIENGLWQCFACGEKGDVLKYIGMRHGIPDFWSIIDFAEKHHYTGPPLTGVAFTQQGPDGRPTVHTNHGQPRDRIEKTWEALLATNDPPDLFRATGGYLVRLREVNGHLQMQPVDNKILTGLLVRKITWLASQPPKKPKNSHPPFDVVTDMLVNPHPDLPLIEAVTTSPVLACDNTLISTPGYHKASAIYFNSLPSESFEVPTNPTQQEVAVAIKFLFEEFLVDFPFASESDRTHALAMLLTPMVRNVIKGTTPLFVIEASVPGSGKSLLAQILSIIVTGSPCAMMSLPRNEDEKRKQITTFLCEGSPLILYDNVNGKIDSQSLAGALTTPVWKDRILGESVSVSPRNRALWVITANNAVLTQELARRSVRVRLEPADAFPDKRTGFLHDPIIPWVELNRVPLIKALLVLVLWWINQGCPHSCKRMGSFESWGGILGGIIEAAGIEGFLENIDEFRANADQESVELNEFVKLWRKTYGTERVTTKELYELAISTEGQLLQFAYASDNGEKSELIRFGKYLGKNKGRVFDSWKIKSGGRTTGGAMTYFLEKVETE